MKEKKKKKSQDRTNSLAILLVRGVHERETVTERRESPSIIEPVANKMCSGRHRRGTQGQVREH